MPVELTLTTGPPANGGSCVARHDGRVVFVRYALPGETVRVRVVADRGSYWHADVVEVLEAVAGPGRLVVPDRRCRTARAAAIWRSPHPTRPVALKGAVVANQLAQLGGYHWRDESDAVAEPVGGGGATGWRTRVRLDTSATTAARDFTATTARSWSPTCAAAQLPAGSARRPERQRLAAGRAAARRARRRRRPPRRAVRPARRQADDDPRRRGRLRGDAAGRTGGSGGCR